MDWNATNISRQQRERCANLAASYRALVEIVSVEAAPELVYARNRARPAPVPSQVIDRLMLSLPPDWPMGDDAFQDDRSYWPVASSNRSPTCRTRRTPGSRSCTRCPMGTRRGRTLRVARSSPPSSLR